jgi:large subunit ribosomal protein L17
MITKARGGDVASLRLIKARLGNNSTATEKLFKEIAPKYKDRKGGYTRITKLGARSGTGDAAEMAVIELV